MKSPIILFVILMFFAGRGHVNGQTGSIHSELTVTSSVQEASAPLNRIVPFTVRIEWEGAPDRYSISSLENPSVTNFSIVSSSASNRVEYRDGRQYSVRVYEFGLQPLELGMGYIESIIVSYTEGDSGATQRAMTQRLGIKITGPVSAPGEGVVLLPAAFIAAVITAGALAYFYRRRRRVQRAEIAPSESEISPEEKALAEMKRAREDVADFRDGIAQLTRLLNGYLSSKFDINAHSLTIDDLLRVLTERGMDESEVEKVKEVSERSDVLKFSGQNVDRGTYEMIFADISRIIEKLKNGRKEHDNRQ